MEGVFVTVPRRINAHALATGQHWRHAVVEHDAALASLRLGKVIPLALRARAGGLSSRFRAPPIPPTKTACSAPVQAGIRLNVMLEQPTAAAMLSLVCAAIVNAVNQTRPPAQARFYRLQNLSASVSVPLCFVWKQEAGSPSLGRFIDVLPVGSGATLPGLPSAVT
ncbi:hypothetical protein CV_0029 [Chromobacterium violaceum ATCC 12472]|uniref:Uncharacterized protein n=2 Tax=Chromobacterium violaceum TaxID=536 RepID=Q7P232_CHRVO|nr:hypothetical protein CV_0029 [Chromobacterium violaceum ATCC 12472]